MKTGSRSELILQSQEFDINPTVRQKCETVGIDVELLKLRPGDTPVVEASIDYAFNMIGKAMESYYQDPDAASKVMPMDISDGLRTHMHEVREEVDSASISAAIRQVTRDEKRAELLEQQARQIVGNVLFRSRMAAEKAMTDLIPAYKKGDSDTYESVGKVFDAYGIALHDMPEDKSSIPENFVPVKHDSLKNNVTKVAVGVVAAGTLLSTVAGPAAANEGNTPSSGNGPDRQGAVVRVEDNGAAKIPEFSARSAKPTNPETSPLPETSASANSSPEVDSSPVDNAEPSADASPQAADTQTPDKPEESASPKQEESASPQTGDDTKVRGHGPADIPNVRPLEVNPSGRIKGYSILRLPKTTTLPESEETTQPKPSPSVGREDAKKSSEVVEPSFEQSDSEVQPTYEQDQVRAKETVGNLDPVMKDPIVRLQMTAQSGNMNDLSAGDDIFAHKDPSKPEKILSMPLATEMHSKVQAQVGLLNGILAGNQIITDIVKEQMAAENLQSEFTDEQTAAFEESLTDDEKQTLTPEQILVAMQYAEYINKPLAAEAQRAVKAAKVNYHLAKLLMQKRSGKDQTHGQKSDSSDTSENVTPAQEDEYLRMAREMAEGKRPLPKGIKLVTGPDGDRTFKVDRSANKFGIDTGYIGEQVDSFDNLSADKKQFLNRLLVGALKVYKHNPNFNVAALVAQGIVESGWGQSSLTKTSNNVFGVKAGSSWKGRSVLVPTFEYYNGVRTEIKDRFRSYSSIEDSINDRVNWLGDLSFYQDAGRCSAKPGKYIDGLLHKLSSDCDISGNEPAYATAPNYKETLMSVIRQYNLEKISENALSRGKHSEHDDSSESKLAVSYLQTDSRWANDYFNGSNIEHSGCGATSYAMAVSNITGKKVTPADVAKWSRGFDGNLGFVGETLAQHGENKYGVKSKLLHTDMSEVMDSLKKGRTVIISGTGSAPFYDGAGHIVYAFGLTDKGNIRIADPMRGPGYIYSPQTIAKNLKYAVAVYKDSNK